MAKQSTFLKQQEQLRRAFFDAGLQSGRQQIIDMLCLVLHDPEVMGKDTFGRERLNKVVAAIGKYIDEYHLAFVRADETDYYREKLDEALANAFNDESIKGSFMQRYEFLPDYDYKIGRWSK